MTLLDKEPVKRVQSILSNFDPEKKVVVLDNSARTALEAASSLGCEVGAIVKSLLFRTENYFTLCLVAGDKKASLNKIKKLPKNTEIFCGHEYTLQNSNFCIINDPNNSKLKNRIIEIKQKIKNNLPTIPTTLENEMECNIFLKAENLERFSKLRDLKDNF